MSPVPVPDGSQTIGDVLVSIVRTVVPGAIATALAWLLSRGFDLTAYGNAVNIYLVPAVLAAYYSLVRAGEARFPWLGILLGYKRQPVYIDQTGAPAPFGSVPRSDDQRNGDL